MRRLAILPALGLLALGGCGTDVTGLAGDTCQTEAAGLAAVATGCTLAAGSTVTLEVQPACQNCGRSGPSCGSELVNGSIELTPIFRVCQNDNSCPTQHCGTPFTCTVTTPSQSGTVEVKYPSGTNGLGVSTTTVTLAPGGATSCSL